MEKKRTRALIGGFLDLIHPLLLAVSLSLLVICGLDLYNRLAPRVALYRETLDQAKTDAAWSDLIDRFNSGVARFSAGGGAVEWANYRLFLPGGFTHYGRAFTNGKELTPFFHAARGGGVTQLTIFNCRWASEATFRSSVSRLNDRYPGLEQYKSEVLFEDPRKPDLYYYRREEGGFFAQAFVQQGDKLFVFIYDDWNGGEEAERELKRIVGSLELSRQGME